MDKRRMNTKKSTKIVDIKQCSYCQVHVPEKDLIQSGDKYYCCQEHLNLDS